MAISKVFSTTIALTTFGGLLAASILAGKAIATPPAQPRLLAQDDRAFELEDFDFWADQCLLLSQEDDYQKTLESCEQGISLRPGDDNISLWTARSTALFDLGQYTEAIASFNQVLDAAPQDSIALAYQCAAYVQLTRYDDAVDTCEAALRINGNWGDRSPGFAWYQRGLALLAKGRLETALDSFTQAVANQPEAIIYEANKCALEIELGIVFATATAPPETATLPPPATPCNLRDTISLYEKALTLEPDNLNLWIQQGSALEQIGDYERALLSYEQAVSLSPEYSLVLARQCGVLNELGSYEEALAVCEAALQGDKRWGRGGSLYGWTQHSRSLIGLEAYEGALASAKRAIDLTPLVDAEAGNDSATAPSLATSEHRSLEPSPVIYPPAWNNLAVSFWHLGDYDQAAWAIARTLEQYAVAESGLAESFERSYPESPLLFYRGYILAHYNQGRILASVGRYGAASNAYQNALSLHSQLILSAQSPIAQLLGANNSLIKPALESLIYTHLSLAYLEVGNSSSSLQSARFAVASNPSSFTAQYNRGYVALETASYSEALDAFGAADRLEPGNVYVLTGQGLALTGLGRTQEALAALEQVVNVLPGYGPAENARACIVRQQGMAVGNNGSAADEAGDITGCVR